MYHLHVGAVFHSHRSKKDALIKLKKIVYGRRQWAQWKVQQTVILPQSFVQVL